MSLTLRDAQHLCWKTFKKLENANQKISQPSETGMDLLKKAEEIARRIQNPDVSSKDNLTRLLSELLYLTFVAAEQHGVNLEEEFLQAIDELILGSVT